MSSFGSQKMKIVRLGCVGAILLAAAGAAFAHHSGAMFDRDKQVELVGTIVSFGWTNPHSWIEIEVPQCGYCQSGQIMSAAVLLRENPKPTDEDIDEAMSGNICRCGTYPRIRRAIHRAAEIQAQRAAK